MIDHYQYQETDSKVVFPLLPYEPRTYSKMTGSWRACFPSEEHEIKTEQHGAHHFFIEQTIGGSLKPHLLPPLEHSSLVKRAWDTIHQTENQHVAKEARRLLLIIQDEIEEIVSFKQFGGDLDHLPPLHAFNVDDGAVLIEWIFTDFRIGFSVEPNLEDSGWYLVSNENLGGISASGYISNIDIRMLVFWLFVLFSQIL